MVEGRIPTHTIEHKAPFGKAHGFIGVRVYGPYLNVTAIKHRCHPIWVSFISQLTPSGPSKIKQVDSENLIYRLLRYEHGFDSVSAGRYNEQGRR